MAIDADYGVGKTFFLKRLAEQMRLRHPVAFVDAWVDDVADEPLVAIAATLQTALKPFLGKAKVKTAFEKVVAASGEVIKIGAIGAAKRIAGLAITAGATELIEKAIKDIGDADKATASDVISDSAEDALDAVQSVITEVAPDKFMRDRIATFKEGQAAIQSMKKSLRALVSSLDAGAIKPPIVIIVDELDRCRPTYSVKLLEEIKHLFDVEGLVFLLGINLDQLERSVKALYGQEFDGNSYLRRFIGRRYRLRVPDLAKLFEYLLSSAPGLNQKLVHPPTRLNDRTKELELAEVLAHYLRAYDLHARDAFQIFDRLLIAAGLTGEVPLLVPYLLPLVIADLKGAQPGTILDPTFPTPLGYQEEWWENSNHREHTVGMEKLAKDMRATAYLRGSERSRVRNKERLSLSEEWVFRITEWAEAKRMPMASPSNYVDLLNAVGAFEMNDQLSR